MELYTDPAIQATVEVTDPEPEVAKDQHFVDHAQQVAREININGVETSAGFAACHGFTPKTQYNEDKS